MKDRSPIGPHEVVDHAIVTRQSVRAFLPTPVPRATIEEILAIATRALGHQYAAVEGDGA